MIASSSRRHSAIVKGYLAWLICDRYSRTTLEVYHRSRAGPSISGGVATSLVFGLQIFGTS